MSGWLSQAPDQSPVLGKPHARLVVLGVGRVVHPESTRRGTEALCQDPPDLVLSTSPLSYKGCGSLLMICIPYKKMDRETVLS